MKLTQAIKYVSEHKGTEEALKLLRHFLDTNDQWSETAFLKSSVSQMMDTIAKEASIVSGVSYDDLRKEVKHYSTTDNETRKWAKYAMGTLHVSGTP